MSFRPCVLIPTHDKDEVRISWRHSRLCAEEVFGSIFRRGRNRGTVREAEAGS